MLGGKHWLSRFGAAFYLFQNIPQTSTINFPDLLTEHAQSIRLPYTTNVWWDRYQKCLQIESEEIFRHFRGATTAWMGANATCHGDHCA